MPSDADYAAAAAVRRADRGDFSPEASVGRCNSCGRHFEYGIGTDVSNLDPSPCCGAEGWEKVGDGLATDGGKDGQGVGHGVGR